jgi:hypothetical protein
MEIIALVAVFFVSTLSIPQEEIKTPPEPTEIEKKIVCTAITETTRYY